MNNKIDWHSVLIFLTGFFLGLLLGPPAHALMTKIVEMLGVELHL